MVSYLMIQFSLIWLISAHRYFYCSVVVCHSAPQSNNPCPRKSSWFSMFHLEKSFIFLPDANHNSISISTILIYHSCIKCIFQLIITYRMCSFWFISNILRTWTYIRLNFSFIVRIYSHSYMTNYDFLIKKYNVNGIIKNKKILLKFLRLYKTFVKYLSYGWNNINT